MTESGHPMYVAAAVARFTRLVAAEDFEQAQRFLDELQANDPLAAPRLAIAALAVAASALNVTPMELATAYAPVADTTDEEIAAMAKATVEFAELVTNPSDPTVAYRWWFDQHPQVCADLLILAVSQLALAYQEKTGHTMGTPCINPGCPIHGAGRFN